LEENYIKPTIERVRSDEELKIKKFHPNIYHPLSKKNNCDMEHQEDKIQRDS
jgi:hypothetical protein